MDSMSKYPFGWFVDIFTVGYFDMMIFSWILGCTYLIYRKSADEMGPIKCVIHIRKVHGAGP